MRDWPMPPIPQWSEEEQATPDTPPPIPPPDVWEFYRSHGRWPTKDEA